MAPIDRFKPYVGRQIKDVADDLKWTADKLGFSQVSYAFPDGIGNIDIDAARLNVHLDKDDRIKFFTKG